MENLQDVLSVASELIVTAFVAAVVWTTVMAGLYQLIRDGIHNVSVAFQRPARERYIQRTDTGPQVAHPRSTTGH